jgi:MoaA/NifB/PqqE/SkfB family radical SAM enzyme
MSLHEEDIDFDFKHIADRELDAKEVTKLKNYAAALGCPSRAISFGGGDHDMLACILDWEEATIVKNLTKTLTSQSKNMSYVVCKRRKLLKASLTRILR